MMMLLTLSKDNAGTFHAEGDLPTGVQHVGHEGDRVDAAGRVHHVDDDAGEGGCLEHTRGEQHEAQ